MKNKFQLLKEWKNVLKKSGKKYSEKAFIWVNSTFFPCFFFCLFFKSNMNRSKRQKKKGYSTQYPVWQPYYQFVN